jgi:membrane protein implicated in regulation of membrane protease activity
MKPATIITIIFLLLVSIAHLLRLIFQVKVTANSADIPLWMSAVACVFTAALAVWLWRENKKTHRETVG